MRTPYSAAPLNNRSALSKSCWVLMLRRERRSVRDSVIATNCGALAEPTHGVGLGARALADFGGAFFHDAGVEDVMGCDGADLVGQSGGDGDSSAAHSHEFKHVRHSLRVDVDYHTNIAG